MSRSERKRRRMISARRSRRHDGEYRGKSICIQRSRKKV